MGRRRSFSNCCQMAGEGLVAMGEGWAVEHFINAKGLVGVVIFAGEICALEPLLHSIRCRGFIQKVVMSRRVSWRRT